MPYKLESRRNSTVSPTGGIFSVRSHNYHVRDHFLQGIFCNSIKSVIMIVSSYIRLLELEKFYGQNKIRKMEVYNPHREKA